MNPWGALIGAGLGVVKNNSEQQKADAERKYQAETARWSPWTGMASHGVANPSLVGNALQGAMMGATMGAGGGGGEGGGIGGMLGGGGGGEAAGTVSGMGPVASGSSYGAMLDNQNLNTAASSPSLFGDSMTSDMFAQPEDYAVNSSGSSYGGMANKGKSKRLTYFDM